MSFAVLVMLGWLSLLPISFVALMVLSRFDAPIRPEPAVVSEVPATAAVLNLEVATVPEPARAPQPEVLTLEPVAVPASATEALVLAQ